MIQVRVKDGVPWMTCFPMQQGAWYDAELILWGVLCLQVRVKHLDMVVEKRFLEVRNADEAKSEAVASVATEESFIPLALPIRSDESSKGGEEHI